MMTARDLQRLAGVHPTLVKALVEIFTEMDASGTPMFVVVGVRTAAQQAALYAQGRTTPGHIVTYKDGYIKLSNHQPHKDGLGHAVDCAFLNVENPFADELPWAAYGLKGEKRGLLWGGRWEGLIDRPHLELP